MRIKINGDVLMKMFQYADSANRYFDSEVAGWAHYTKEKGIYKLAPLLEQEISPAGVDNHKMDSILNSSYKIDDMMVQWHSHVNMKVFLSPTDVANIKDTLKLMPMLISIVVNCRGQYYAQVDISQVNGIRLDTAISIATDLSPQWNVGWVNKDIKKNLRKPKPKLQLVKPDFPKSDHPIYQQVQQTELFDGFYDWNYEHSLNVKKEVTKTSVSIQWDKSDLIISASRLRTLARLNNISIFFEEIGDVNVNGVIRVLCLLDQSELEIDKESAILMIDNKEKEGGKEIVDEFIDHCNKIIKERIK